MKNNDMKMQVTCLTLLASLFIFGCAQHNASKSMDNSMAGTMDEMKQPEMAKSMEAMQDQKMEEPMEKMGGQKMDNTMNEMKNDAAKSDMNGME